MDRWYVPTLTALTAALSGAAAGPQHAGAGTAPALADTIPLPTSEFRAEHGTLLGGFGVMMSKAVAPQATHTDRANLVLFLRADLLPHAQSEERVLYPAVDSVLGTRGYATATMVLDHRTIARLVDDLAALAGSPNPEAYRRRAYALDAVLESHFAKEEQFILPILRQKLSAGELRALFERMGSLPPEK